MSKTVNVDFTTRVIEIETDGKEHFISAALAAKNANADAQTAKKAAEDAEGAKNEISTIAGTDYKKVYNSVVNIDNKIAQANAAANLAQQYQTTTGQLKDETSTLANNANISAVNARQYAESAKQALRDTTIINNSGNADTLSTTNAADIIELKEELSEMYEEVTTGILTLKSSDFINGSYKSDGTLTLGEGNIIRTDLIKVSKGDKVNVSDVPTRQVALCSVFNIDGTIKIDSQWGQGMPYTATTQEYVIVMFRRSGGLEPSDYNAHVIVERRISKEQSEIKNEVDLLINKTFTVPEVKWVKKFINVHNGVLTTSNNDICTEKTFIAYTGSIISVNNGFEFGLFEYDNDGNFVKQIKTYGSGEYLIKKDGYYRVSARFESQEDISNIFDVSYNINLSKVRSTSIYDISISNAKKIDAIEKNVIISPFDKRSIINIGLPIPSDYYVGISESYIDKSFSKDTDSNTIYNAFDELLVSPYISKDDLGVCSDNIHHLYSYTVKSHDAIYAKQKKKKPKVLIICGQHGFEKASVYGLYYFVRNLLTKWNKDKILEWIIDNIELKFIPICNPYGWDNQSYYNFNNVNLNRNYDTKAYVCGGTGTNNGGVAPFDQPETQIIRDFVFANLDAMVFIDFHTNGRYSVPENSKINWFDIPYNEDKYYENVLDACKSHLDRQTMHFSKQFGVKNELCGKITFGDGGYSADFPSADVWARDQGIIGLTIEGFGGFPDKNAYNAECLQGNEQIIANWLISAMNHLIN